VQIYELNISAHNYGQINIFTSIIKSANNSRLQMETNVKKYRPPKEIKPEHQELMSKIGKRLTEVRLEKKISSSGLAKELGISRNAYHLMEAGKIYFNVLSLLQILDYHQIPATAFFENL